MTTGRINQVGRRHKGASSAESAQRRLVAATEPSDIATCFHSLTNTHCSKEQCEQKELTFDGAQLDTARVAKTVVSVSPAGLLQELRSRSKQLPIRFQGAQRIV
jgi:hypothetical protein